MPAILINKGIKPNLIIIFLLLFRCLLFKMIELFIDHTAPDSNIFLVFLKNVYVYFFIVNTFIDVCCTQHRLILSLAFDFYVLHYFPRGVLT